MLHYRQAVIFNQAEAMMIDETRLTEGGMTRVSIETMRRLKEWRIKLAQKLGDIPSSDRVIAAALDALEVQEMADKERV
jgi:hypothetical protein